MNNVQFQLPDLSLAMPEIILAVLAMIILLADLVIKRKETLAFLSIIGIFVSAFYALTGTSGAAFGNMFISDSYSAFFKLIFFFAAFLTILISVRHIAIEKINFGEYYALILFSTLGMMIMVSTKNLMVLYLGLELMSRAICILSGFIRSDSRSNEAALKYLILGAFSSAFLLYGISIIYGLTGTTDLRAIAVYINENGLTGNKMLLLSVIFFVVAFGFNIAIAPFHMWTPDVYEGAPTAITAFMSVGPKAAGFAIIGRVFYEAFGALYVYWGNMLLPLALITIVIGNVIALSQTNIKRMLAYSSIAHSGYALLGIIAGTPDGLMSTMNYLMIYAFMNIGAFSVVIMLRREGFSGVDIDDYQGLAKKHPITAAAMLVFMFSLTGIPPTAGFFGKFYVFMEAVKAGYVEIVVIAVIFSAVSAYFYLRIVMYMYMREPKEDIMLKASPSISLALVITAAGTLLFGIMPSALIELVRKSVGGMF